MPEATSEETAATRAEATPGEGWTDRVATADDAPHIFPCESCGADQEFYIGHDSLRCPFCGFVKEIPLDEDVEVEERDYHATLRALQEKTEPDAAAEGEQVQCDSCSAQVVFEGAVTSTQCAYCGSPIQRAGVHTTNGRIPVDGVIPFAVDKDNATASLKRWMSKLWFAPSKFKKQAALGRFEGVYLPYWTFDTMTFCSWSGRRGDHYTETRGSGDNRRTVRKTRWSRRSGSFQRFFDDVLTLAAQKVPTKLLRNLEPWPLQKLVPFQPEYLAGLQARTYDTKLEDGFDVAQDRIHAALHADVRRRIGGDVQRVDQLDARHDAITFKHILLPLWLLTYRYSGKTYQVVVNAETAEVYGERPWSVLKILFAIFCAGLLLLFFTWVSN